MTQYHFSYQPTLTFLASAASLAEFSASLAALAVSLAASSATLASYVATSVAGSVAHSNVAAIQNQVLSEIEFALLS